MWAAYDSLTNSFAIEGLRYMIGAADRLGKPELAAQWGKFRDRLIAGLDNSLKCTAIWPSVHSGHPEHPEYPERPCAGTR